MKFIIVDDEGRYLAGYSEEIHGSSIPPGAVEVEDEVWSELVANQQTRRYVDGALVSCDPSPSPITAEMVKAECRRRILLIMTEDQQRNTLATGQAAVMQYGADPAGWPEGLQQRQAAAMTAWAEIERLRARSNEIEDMEPIPADLGDDALWSFAAQ